MINLRVAVPAGRADEIVDALARTGQVRRLMTGGSKDATDHVVIDGDVDAAGVDDAAAVLKRLGIGEEAYRLARIDVVAPISGAHEGVTAGGNISWTEVMAAARLNSRLNSRYGALTIVAGLIAAMGVLSGNQILIVGAMAVSPDLLAVCAACIAIVGRRPTLARHALATLVLGLALVAVVAGLVTAALDATGLLASGFHIGQGGLGGLAQTNYSTVIVALAAGVAATLSFETRASAAVGVAISVTTIPASAYLGVAVATGEHGLGALLVLAVNVVLMVLSGTITVAVQQRFSPDS